MRETTSLNYSVCAIISCLLVVTLLLHNETQGRFDDADTPEDSVPRAHNMTYDSVPEAPPLEDPKGTFCLLPRGLSAAVQRSTVQDAVYGAMEGDKSRMVRSIDQVCTRSSRRRCPQCSYCPWESRDRNVILTLGDMTEPRLNLYLKWLPVGTHVISLDGQLADGYFSTFQEVAPLLNVTRYAIRLAVLSGPHTEKMLRMLVDSESGWVPEQIVLAHGSKSLNSDWTELVSFRRSGLVPIAQQSSLTSEASPVIPTTYMLVCDWSNINGPFRDRWSAHELRRMKDETSGTTIRYPASACSAFAIVSINNLAGLGHRVWDIVLGVIFSLSARTPFRLDVSRLEGTGDHGRYDFLVSGGFLPLDEVFITKHEIKMFFPGSDRNVKLDNDKFEEVVFRRQNVTLECNKTSRFFTDRLCNDDWCFMDTFHGRTQDPHQLARPFFTQAMQRSRFLALRDLRPRNSLVCMWHIRTGDIALGNSTAFQTNLVGLLARVLKGTSIVVYIATTEETFAVKEALALCDRHGLNAQVLLEDLPTTLHGMIHADVLIHCGSSLTHVAALCSPSTLHLLPQEKDNPSTELPKFLDGSFHLENNGRLHEPEEQLRAKLLENYEAIVRTEWI